MRPEVLNAAAADNNCARWQRWPERPNLPLVASQALHQNGAVLAPLSRVLGLGLPRGQPDCPFGRSACRTHVRNGDLESDAATAIPSQSRALQPIF